MTSRVLTLKKRSLTKSYLFDAVADPDKAFGGEK